jgi:molybdate transport system substrate-binding protein
LNPETASRRISAIRVLTCVFALSACGPAREPTLLVGAASDLALAMPALAAAFSAETGIQVTTTLGSSGQLAQQILHGAPVDVFLSADREWVDRLDEAGLVQADGRAIYARGVLVIVTARRRGTAFQRLEELGAPDVRRVAIANPDHAPYGRAARDALAAAGVLDALSDRLVIAENVRQTLQFVGTGDVDAAIAALSLVDDESPAWVIVPEHLHAPLLQEAAVLTGRGDEEGRAFLRFLTGPRGLEILAGFGFLMHGPSPP